MKYIDRAVAILLLSFFPTLAQAQGFCDPSVDPHSFACASDTFEGKLFPLANMTDATPALDNWNLLTYADAKGAPGPEFDVLVSQQNPRIPEGVFNRFDGSQVGSLDWTTRGVFMSNWRMFGNTLSTTSQVNITDRHTINATIGNRQEMHGLSCRIFLRNDKDHLLCRWFAHDGTRFVFRGYLGFLGSH